MYRRWKAQRLEDKIADDDVGSAGDTKKKVAMTWDQIEQIGNEEIKKFVQEFSGESNDNLNSKVHGV